MLPASATVCDPSPTPGQSSRRRSPLLPRLRSSPLETHPFRFLRHVGRVSQIVTVLVSHGFGDLIERLGFRRYVEWGKRRLFRRPPEISRTTPERIRLAFEELGPTFIKFGQVMSTRPDLLPADLIEELANLQEHVPTFESDEAVRLVEAELHRPIDELFASSTARRWPRARWGRCTGPCIATARNWRSRSVARGPCGKSNGTLADD